MVNTDVDLLLLFLFFCLFFVVAAGTVFTFVPSLPMRILNVMSLVSLCFDKKDPQFVHGVKTPSVPIAMTQRPLGRDGFY